MAPTRKEIIAAAREWVIARVPYSMFAFRDGWRTDCSGLVSMAWRLDRNYWTGNLDRAGVRIPFRDLQPGDMLLFHNPANPNVGSHVVLFEAWITRPTDQDPDFWIIEQTGAGARTTRRITWHATFRSNLARYVPYRPRLLATDQPLEGEDMKIILGNVHGQATVWSGLRGLVPAFAHSIPESVDALAAAGAHRQEFSSAEAMFGALGVEDGSDANTTLQRMKDAK